MCMNKPKTNSKYNEERLYGKNMINYLRDFFGKEKLKSYKQINIIPFLQSNYGEEGDCTLVSILTIVKFYNPKLDPNEIYDYIEKIAKKYLYNSKIGTFSLFNKSIIKEVFQHFNINKKITSKYLKDIGFNKQIIIEELNKNTPIIISITNDGRNYYKNHSVVINGYSLYENEKGEERLMLRIYDN